MEFRKFLPLNNLNKEVLLKSILIICLLSAKSEPFPYDNVRSNNWATPFQNWAKLGEKNISMAQFWNTFLQANWS